MGGVEKYIAGWVFSSLSNNFDIKLCIKIQDDATSMFLIHGLCKCLWFPASARLSVAPVGVPQPSVVF